MTNEPDNKITKYYKAEHKITPVSYHKASQQPKYPKNPKKATPKREIKGRQLNVAKKKIHNIHIFIYLFIIRAVVDDIWEGWLMMPVSQARIKSTVIN